MADCFLYLTPMTEKRLELLAPEKRQRRKENNMNKDLNKTDDELPPEYDLSKLKGRIRGKYVERYQKGTNVILLDPDVAEAFPDSQSVNQALRTLMNAAQK